MEWSHMDNPDKISNGVSIRIVSIATEDGTQTFKYYYCKTCHHRLKMCGFFHYRCPECNKKIAAADLEG